MRSITITKDFKPLTFNEIEAVQFVGQFLEISEYEVIQLAHNHWYGKKITESRINYLFENYIDEEIIPFWVWSFVKDVIKKYEKNEINPTDYGITPIVLTRRQKIVGWLIVLGVALLSFLYSWLPTRIAL